MVGVGCLNPISVASFQLASVAGAGGTGMLGMMSWLFRMSTRLGMPWAAEVSGVMLPAASVPQVFKLTSVSLLSSEFMIHPSASCLTLFKQADCVAFCLALFNAGSSIAARMAIMAMTNSSSIRVNAGDEQLLFILIGSYCSNKMCVVPFLWRWPMPQQHGRKNSNDRDDKQQNGSPNTFLHRQG